MCQTFFPLLLTVPGVKFTQDYDSQGLQLDGKQRYSNEPSSTVSAPSFGKFKHTLYISSIFFL